MIRLLQRVLAWTVIAIAGSLIVGLGYLNAAAVWTDGPAVWVMTAVFSVVFLAAMMGR